MRLKCGALLFLLAPGLIFAQNIVVSGRVVDPQGEALPKADVRLLDHQHAVAHATSGPDGKFELQVQLAGEYFLNVEAPAFRAVHRSVVVRAGRNETLQIRMDTLSIRSESVTVTADVAGVDVQAPDPAERVFVSEDLLDANPGRPGAPVSIPGYPIETASSGIKAPQYFAPGVAGDHGEPIAQFVQVGAYLVPNNLSANAHGNGYTDPNIYIADVIESVEVDGGAFNVREGNHALNLATTYALRSHLDPFFTLTADNRDITGTAGLSPSDHSWIAIEGSYGNGFLDRLEHRKQVKTQPRPGLPRGSSHADLSSESVTMASPMWRD